jgi:hypothetical protein
VLKCQTQKIIKMAFQNCTLGIPSRRENFLSAHILCRLHVSLDSVDCGAHCGCWVSCFFHFNRSLCYTLRLTFSPSVHYVHIMVSVHIFLLISKKPQCIFCKILSLVYLSVLSGPMHSLKWLKSYSWVQSKVTFFVKITAWWKVPVIAGTWRYCGRCIVW